MQESLHARRIKPLMMYPEADPNIVDAASFLQYSSARFLYSDEAVADQASTTAQSIAELEKFLGNVYSNDHPVVCAHRLAMIYIVCRNFIQIINCHWFN